MNVLIFGVGASLLGYLSDKFGRRKVTVVTLALGITFNLIESLSVNYLMYLVINSIAGLAINGTYLTPYVLSTELVGEKYAGFVSQIINLPFVAGEMLFVLVAYFFRQNFISSSFISKT